MYHQVLIVGNVGADPTMRYTPSGQAVTSFSVATNHQFTRSDGEKANQVTWFRVVTWEKLAEISNQYLKKGSKVLVEGRLMSGVDGNPKTFDRQDSSTGATFEVNASTVRFLSSRAEPAGPEGAEIPAEDDIPF